MELDAKRRRIVISWHALALESVVDTRPAIILGLSLAWVIAGCGSDSSNRPAPTAAPTPVPTLSMSPTPAPTPSSAGAGPVAWAIGQDTIGPSSTVRELVIKSSDGGRTWETQSVFENRPSLQSIQFIDRDVGWLVGGQAFLQSTDGGRTWIDRLGDLPLENLGLGDVSFDGRERGIVVGSEFDPEDPIGGERFPTVVYTNDGGNTWQLAAVPHQNGVELTEACLGRGGVGLAVGAGASGGRLALLTRDGGATWTDITARIPLVAVVACPEDDLWALGGGLGQTSVSRSSDSGETWEDLSPHVPIEAGADGVAFADPDHGWFLAAPGSGGSVILRTEDAGQTWSEQPTPGDARTNLRAIAVASLEDGVIVGSELSIESPPVILFTSDGGTNWTPASIPESLFALLDVSIVP